MRKKKPNQLAKLKARVKFLEGLLICENCEHLRHEHGDNDGPCYGGRSPDLKPGEGDYCNCGGFETAEATL